jgi:hypothetical protein
VPPAHAQKIVTIFMDGAWCQKTTGPGTDNVSVAAAVDRIPASGEWNPGNVKTNVYKVGTYSDRGGPAKQEMRKLTLARIALQPGDAAEIVVAMYGGGGNRSFFDHLRQVFKKRAPDIAAAVATALGSPVAGAIARASMEKIVEAVSGALKSADDHYVGDAKIQVFLDANNHLTYKIEPNTNASDLGTTPAGSHSIALNGPRAQYWIKLAVK